MKISLLQTDIQWADPVANREALGPTLLACRESDLCVLPEMWPTGFLTEPEEAGTRDQQENILWLQSMADRMTAIVFVTTVKIAISASYVCSVLYNLLVRITNRIK